MKNEKKSISIMYLLILVYMCMSLKFSTINIIKILAMLFITIITLAINYYFFEKKNIEVHKKFMICAMIFGFILIFINPILHGIDEGAHFFKVYSLICGTEDLYNNQNELVDKVPKAIYNADCVKKYVDIFNVKNTKIDKNDYIIINEYIGAKLYSIFSYIPYLLPMLIFQKILNMDIIGVIYIGRICAFICWVLISTYTIKIIPRRKEFIAFLCLMPISLTLVTTYTGDLVTNSVILLFLAYWYRLYCEKRLISSKEIIIITILGIISASAKLVYSIIFFLLMILPIECFKNQKHKIKIIFLIIISIIVATFINLSIVGNDLINAYPKIKLQKEFILSNMAKYIWILISTIITNFPIYVCQFTTGKITMCHNAIRVNDVFSILYVAILIVSVLSEKSEMNLKKSEKILISIIISLIVIIIFTSLYLQWTATNYGIGANQVYGVQGRYFTPIVALFILANTKNDYKFDKKYLWTSVLLINIIIIFKIIINF